jgi:4-amino-4-deoxy-L-arabinose transferase-like glycosyltransferase
MTMARREWIALSALLVVAGLLRFSFLGHGLPETPYVDSFRFVDEALSLLAGGDDWIPDDFMYPGLFKLILAILYRLFEVESRLWLHLVPRIVASVADLGTVALVFAIVRRLGGVYAGVLAGALYGACIIAVTSARVETVDSLLTFLLTATVAVMTRPRLRLVHFLLAGLLLGCAAGSKYTGIYGLLPIAYGVVARAREHGRLLPALGLGLLAGLLGAAVFLACTPWFVPFFDIYLLAIRVQIETQQLGQLGHVQASPFDYLISPVPTWEQPWLHSSLLYTMGPLVLVAALGAVITALWGRLGPVPLGFGLYTLVFYLLLAGTGRVKAIRYLLPIVPVVCALVGLWAARLLALRTERRAHFGLLAAALVAFPLYRTVPHLGAAAELTTSELARTWGAEHLPAGARVLLSPFYLENLGTLPIEVRRLSRAAQLQYRLRASLGSDTEETPLFRPELVDSMIAAGIGYVVLSSYFEGCLYPTAENRRFFPASVAAYAAFRRRLAERGELVYHVVGHAAGRLGPDIHVYRLVDAPAPPGVRLLP